MTGALVLVTNGIYGAGGRDGNRVVVDRPVILRSVNGPELTLITGSGTTRCVYLTNAASLSGFTLTNGVADYGAGVRCESDSEVVSNCSLAGNSASAGGGAYKGTLNNCTLTGNSAYGSGGGAYRGTLNNCTLTGNSAGDGGGASEGTLNNCTLTSNSAGDSGGGASCSTLNNCTLTGNSAHFYGGGVSWGTLNNCTLTGNSASSGGGASGGTLNNCIVFFNRAPNGANYRESAFTYSCTTPLPPGVGNIDADPQLASITHLSPISPCIGAGSPAYATGVDIDGEPWARPPAMGAINRDRSPAHSASGSTPASPTWCPVTRSPSRP